jgi:HEAT repeat protein
MALARAERRRLATDLLLAWDLPGLEEAAGREPRLTTVLVGLLSELDDRLRWRAVHALGRLAGQRAEVDLDAVRDLVRRQLWSMNDESGNVAWHAPEAIAEILFFVPALRPAFVPNLLAHLEEDLFRAGVLWGAARLALVCPELIAAEAEGLSRVLSDEDPARRGLAALALARCGQRESLAPLLADAGELALFDETRGELQTVTVAALIAA